MLHSRIIHHREQQVYTFGADLSSVAATAEKNRRGRAPGSFCRPAGRKATSIAATNNEAGFLHARDNDHTFRVAEYFLRNSLIWGLHNFSQRHRGCLDAILDFLVILVTLLLGAPALTYTGHGKR